MSALRETSVFDEYGRPVPGALVYVTNSAGFNAVLASDAGGMALLAQPIVTDEFGVYRYYAADGFYREDIWYSGKLRYSSAGVPVGDTVGLLPEAVFRSEAARDGAEAAEASVLASLHGAAFSSLILSAASRNILAALSTSTGLPAILTENYRGGTFKWVGTNLKAKVDIDPQQGVYVPPTGQDGTTGAWVRQYSDVLNVKWFGASGDDIMDDSTAIRAAIAFSYANAQDGTGFGKAGPSIKFPLGKYYLQAQTLDITHTVEMYGEGGGAFGATAQLRWDDSTTGFRFQGNDTTGDSTSGAQAYPGSYGSILRNFYLKGGYAGVESEHHGILMRAKLELDNVLIDNFPGDAIAGLTDSGMGGNANGFRFRRVWTRNCRDGTRVSGLNTNVGSARDCIWTDNRRWGVWDDSQIGNEWHGIDENNGRSVGATPCLVSYDGGSGSNWYAVIIGQEAGAATHAPSGTTADNAYWYYCNPGAVNPIAPAWFNGIVVRAGGAARSTRASANVTFSDFWTEYAQGPMQLVEPTRVDGGSQISNVRGISRMQKTQFGFQVEKLRIALQGLFGPSLTDPAANGDWIFDNTLAHTLISFRRWVSSVTSTIDGAIQADANGLSVTGIPTLNLLADPGTGAVVVGYIDGDGLHLNYFSGNTGLYVAGQKVVGTQQGVIVNAANILIDPTYTDHNALVGSINAILAAMRTHGLIDT